MMPAVCRTAPGLRGTFLSVLAGAFLFVLSAAAGVSPAEAAIPCGPGTYSATGMEPCEPAPLGYFVSGIGATSATAASPGNFVDTVGSPFQQQAPAGYYSAGAGEILPGAALPGYFQPNTGQFTSIACLPGTASRGGAAVCLEVPDGVPTALGPEFNSTLGTSGTTDFGHLDVAPGTWETGAVAFDFTVTNEATDYGLESDELSSDLTLISAVFRGDDPGRFSLDGFTPGMVLGEGESATFTLRIDPFLASDYDTTLKTEISAYLTFRTDQGNRRGFDPLALGFDPAGVEAKYAEFRDAGGPETINGGTSNLSREFTFGFVAGIPAPGATAILVLSVLGLFAARRRLAGGRSA